MNIWKWIKDRLFERSTKLWISQVLGLLVIIGLVPVERQAKIEETIDQGQQVYEEVADSVSAAIDLGQEKIEEGKQVIQYAKDTTFRLRDILVALWTMALSAIGIGSKDAKRGIEYEQREEVLMTAMQSVGMEPDKILLGTEESSFP